MKATKTRKAATKKTSSEPRKKAMKVLKAKELREKLLERPKTAFVVLDNQRFSLSPRDIRTLIEALKESSKDQKDLSTQEVADLLNVSRPYVVKLIESQQLRSFNVGSHRRVRESDAIEFRRKMRGEQNRALDELAEETEKLNLEFE